MLLEVTADEVAEVTPIVPTWEQYTRYLSGIAQITQRILIGILVGVSLLVLSRLFGESSFLGVLTFFAGMLAFLYPFCGGQFMSLPAAIWRFENCPTPDYFLVRY